VRDYRWEHTENVALHPYGRPQGFFAQIEIWVQESPQSALLALLFAFVVTLIIGLMGVYGGGPDRLPVANVSVVQIVLGDGRGELEAAATEATAASGGGQVVSGNNDGSGAADVQDVSVTQVKDEFGDLPDPNASVKVDPAKAARLKNNIKNLADGIQIKGLPNATTLGGGVPISGVFHELIKDSKSAVFVIDKSGSMYGMPLQRVSAELNYAIQHLREEQTFFVIFFDHTAWPMFTNQGGSGLSSAQKIQLVVGTEKNKQDAIQWINGMRGGGGTEPGGAMLLALNARPAKIVLLSDGEFSPQYIDQITKQNRGETIIDCIGLAEDIFTLQQIAAHNKGKYFTAK
jgi:hypothetical protein